jgi:uncharacterized protein YxjI
MTTYFIEQKITAFANQYQVFGAEGETKGPLLAFVHQKRLAMRENIIFYSDDTKSEVSFQIKTQNLMEMAATYNVLDAEGKVLGRLKKEFSSSLLRSTWSVLGPEGNDVLVTVQERSVPKAIARRIWGFLPYIGDLPFFLKYHFDFIDKKSGETVGAYNKETLIYDHYRLVVEDALTEMLDWRVLVAMGVSLDALQSR